MGGYTYLAHHGIKGMRWGVRRYQNPDGSLTDEGLLRYRNKHESVAYNFRNASSNFGGSKTSIGRYLSKKSDAHLAKATEYSDEYSKRMRSKPVEVTDDMISAYAKANGVSKEEAYQHAKYAMENYKRAEKSDVIKKYPHDFATYGHPLLAGGYASEKLMNDIETKSGSWYFGEAVSTRFKKAQAEYTKIRDRADKASSFDERRGLRTKANNVLLDAVLKDLGFSTTQVNRDAIESSVFWD